MSKCWCNNPNPIHAHADARDWYCRNVPGSDFGGEPKQTAWYHFATLFYKLGITIIY